MQKLIFLLCRILAALPLKSLHAMAGFWGGLAFYLLHKDRARIRENLQIAGLPADDAAVKKVLRETAKGALELPVAFFRRPEDIETLFREVHGWQHIQAALDACEGLPGGKGFVLHVEPLQGSLNGDKKHDAEIINHNVEYWIRRFPDQYLFAYNRYKHPAGAEERPSEQAV